ncbi:GGDEF domain-containing protein [Gemmiger sp.]
MKFVCKKGNDARQMLELVGEFVGKMAPGYPELAEDLELDVKLQAKDGTPCPENDAAYCFDEPELRAATTKKERTDDAYNYDALTGLYNRSRYERDIQAARELGYRQLCCIYIDAVGLHEINNHLGHQAGDDMLRSIADGIRAVFPDSCGYRIGGDEFVVLCFDTPLRAAEEALERLQRLVREQEFEISVGAAEGTDPAAIETTINTAEKAMRRHKADFYAQNGAERQMRTLNHKLEKLLQEKQDASRFLNVIAPRYLGVYMVNPKDDSCRYIYIPKYFQKMLEENDGRFSPAIRRYYETFVRKEYHDLFRALTDYDYVRGQLDAGHVVEFTYQKLDGSRVRLKITLYDSNTPENEEMQWIFVDDNR